MKAVMKIEFIGSDTPHISETVARSLAPDNLSNMDTQITDNCATIHISTEKLSSLIAVMDDLLMNAKIAEDVQQQIEDS
ncbi:MAG: hypothetical protein K8R64_04135 [Methanosarcinaceae archaeon]|nr:hypothetical protein [Methanosarcinaceae archaeon]